METITTSELDEDILLVLDQVVEDAEEGLNPNVAPDLMFTPNAAARLAKALRCLIQEEWWEKYQTEESNEDWDDERYPDGSYAGDAADLWS